MVKGIGYTIEGILAITAVFLFLLGSITVSQGQNWAEFRQEVSTEDLTVALEKTGYIEHAVRNGETGSLQNAFSTLPEIDTEVSGRISNLPINRNRIAFYVINEERYTQELREVKSSDKCYDDLEEINDRSEREVYRTDTLIPELSHHSETLYVADRDPTVNDGDGVRNYDSLWVDNGTKCQFDSDEGPFNVEEIFKWGNESFDMKYIDGNSEELRLYNATQPVRFQKTLNKPVNSVKTFNTIDTVNFTRLNNLQYDSAVIRKENAVEDINNSDNRAKMESFLREGSVLFLADLDQSNFDDGKFLNDAGFRHVDVSYKGGYSGSATSGFFTKSSASQEAETYFKGLDPSGTKSIEPSAKVLSSDQRDIQSGKAILKASEQYNFSEWNSKTKDMKEANPAKIEGEPESECYSANNRALTNKSFNFPEQNYHVINVELGSSNSFCNNNNVRGVKIDLDADGNFNNPNEGVYLNGESLRVDNRQYGLKIIPNGSETGCDEEGECVEFVYLGDREVELIPKRISFPNLNGKKIAMTGYERNYGETDRKLLASTIYWLRGDNVRFSGNRQPEGISTDIVSAIQNQTYMPYELNLRWAR